MATPDLHKDSLGYPTSLGYMAKRAQPALYDANTILHLTHQPVSIWDSEEALVQQVVSMKKMSEKPGHVRPANGFYEKLNALKFVPQQELSREQAYWLPANERASQTSNQTSPVTPFVHKCRPPSQVLASFEKLSLLFFNLKVTTELVATKGNLELTNSVERSITSLRIQLDGLKVENVSLKRRYDELSKANTHSRTAYTEKLSAFTAENTKLKAQVTGKTSSGPSTSEKPKVLASGMYTKSSKNLPGTSNRPTQKPPVQQNKKPNVSVNLSTRTKPATASRKPMPKSHTQNHRILPSKSVNARRAADHNRKLNVSLEATRNIMLNPLLRQLGDPKERIMEPIVEPLELTPSVSSSSKVTMISRFTDCKLNDRKAGSKGLSVILWNAEERDVVHRRKNKTLIEAARTMLADSFLPNTFWAEAVSTACYVLNRVLVTKPQNKTPYELITGKIPIISYIRPFGCHVTILNTIDHLGKFEEKSDEGFLVGYSLNSKAFRVYNLETKRVEENLHINFLENKPNVAGKGPNWLFDLDYLTDSMNYQPVTAENKANKTAGPKEANHNAGTQDNIDAGNSEMEAEPAQEYFVLPLWSSYTSTVKSSKAKNGDEKTNGDTGPMTNEEPKDQDDQAFLEELERLKRQEKEANDAAEVFRKEFAQCTEELLLQAEAARAASTNTVNTVSTPISTASPSNVFSAGRPDLTNNDQDDSQILALKDIYDNPSDGIFTNASYDDEGTVADFINLETTVNIEPKKISQSLEDESWVDAMQEELLQFKIQKVYRNKKDERGVVVRNKARLVAQGYRQEEGIDYDEVFAHVARIEAIRIFLAFDSYIGFIVYQMDVKSAFLYGTINEEMYVTHPLGFVDPKFPKKVYKVVKALYGLHQAPRAWYATLSTFLLKSGYRRGTIDKTIFIKKDKKDIILVQVYVDDIIFGSTKKSWYDEFEALIKSRFQMSSMGELTFFLGLQVK
ncbi:putative ribonuclease H-like domain-containing protein [Tanacetum coccineum]